MSLDKVGREQDELRDSNFQLKSHIDDLKASRSALKEVHVSCSHRAEIAEYQTQSLILKVVDLDNKWKSQPSAAKGSEPCSSHRFRLYPYSLLQLGCF